MRTASWWVTATALVLAAGPAFAQSPDAALKALSGDDLDASAEAAAYLQSLPDLLSKHGKALGTILTKNPKEPMVAQRVLDLVRTRGGDGCAFIAAQVGPSRPAWVESVVERFPTLPRCEKLETALADVLVWTPDPASSPDAARMVSRVLALAWEARLSRAGAKACRFVLAGPEPIRRQAIETVVAVKAPGGDACLVQAYNDAVQRNTSGDIRLALLRAVAAFAGVDSVPTLVLALDRPDDELVACELLLASGREGLNGMVFALRSGDGRSPGVRNCLLKAGDAVVPGVLPLLDHPSERVRSFALEYLAVNRSPQALRVLRDRFVTPGKGDRAIVLDLLSLYPVSETRDVIESALGDPDPAMRLQALSGVERSRSQAFSKRLATMSEDDPVPEVRRRALEVSWHVGDEAIVAPARRLVEYETVEIRALAARVLGFLGGEKAVDTLAPLRKDRSPTVADMAREALWLLTYADPEKGKLKFRAAGKVRVPEPGRELGCDGTKVTVLGKKGPLVVVLPGGPAIDLGWARPWLDELADDAVVAFVDPPVGDGTDARATAGLPGPQLLACVLKTLERDRAVLVSDGLGAVNALWLAAETPAAVAGIAAISSPLPGRIDEFHQGMLAALPESYRPAASVLVETQAKFAPDALNRYLARVLAPVHGGGEEPWKVLAIPVDALRSARASAVLSRPEAGVVPAEGQRVLFLLPDDLPPAVRGPYDEWAPGKVTVETLEGCGYLPEVACESKVLKQLERFSASVGSGK